MTDVIDVSKCLHPLFRPLDQIPLPARTDPDHALKEIEKKNAERFSVACSKCHHCR